MILRQTWKLLDGMGSHRSLDADTRVLLTVADGHDARNVRRAYREMRRAGLSRSAAALHIHLLVGVAVAYTPERRKASA